MRWLRRALEILDQAPSDDSALRNLEARCRLDLARQCETPKEIAEAISQAEKATTLWRSLLSAEPDNDENRWKLCVALSVLSRLLSSDGKIREAEAFVSECAATAQNWKEESGSYYVLNSRAELADALRLLALSLAVQDRYDEAIAHFQTAINLLDGLHKQNPHYVQARSVVHGVYWSRAMIYGRMGRQQQALEDWDKCVDVSEGDLRNIAWISRTKFRIDMRDYARAAADADELLASGELPGNTLFELATIYCDCAAASLLADELHSDEVTRSKEELESRAIECLVQCRSSDFFNDPAHREMLETTPALTILSSRLDFQQLRDEVNAIADER
jgi:tetratricopeptide (TPR) repeat protein